MTVTDLVARLREAIDAEAQDVELSISNEIESLRADGGIVMTREEILACDAEEEGGGPYTRRLRRCAADRKILDWIVEVEQYSLDHTLWNAPEVEVPLAALAEAYGVEEQA